jgi:hypothetical protein
VRWGGGCGPCGEGQFGADDGTNAGTECGAMKARGAVDTITIEQRDGRVPVAGSLIDQRLWKRGCFEKTEGGGGVELDVHDLTH